MSITSTKHFVSGVTVLERSPNSPAGSWDHLLWVGWVRGTREARCRRPDGLGEHLLMAGLLGAHWCEVTDEGRAQELRERYGWLRL